MDGPGRQEEKYPRDGLEIFWNHTNIHRKYRIEALAFSILAHSPTFPAIYVLHVLQTSIAVTCSIHLIEFNSCQHYAIFPHLSAVQEICFLRYSLGYPLKATASTEYLGMVDHPGHAYCQTSYRIGLI